MAPFPIPIILRVLFRAVNDDNNPRSFLNHFSFSDACCLFHLLSLALLIHFYLFQWNLVCERDFLLQVVQSVYMAGFLAGSAVFGQLSDM